MKLVSLNIQGGAQGEAFFKYVKQAAKTADVLCFQEVYKAARTITAHRGEQMDIYNQLQKQLTGFNGIFLPVSRTVGKHFGLKQKVEMGMAIFTIRGLNTGKHFGKHVDGSLESRIDFEQGKSANAAQVLELRLPEGSVWVVNFHGVFWPGTKLDTPKRLRQSKILISLMKKLKGPKVLCGDFNLMPETESVKMLERAGMVNLIRKYKIKNTRNTISWKRHNNRQYFADFTFTTPDVQVKNFKVPYNLASDHLPMVVEFAL